ncbi:helix-turn-helix domain-containing protein [Haladaptatus pallidirubidus]|uniref:HTH DNA binding domain-containing protein n=1 Tax=Haladaptatus pallidirubidus TaxID=1008152 RepID=A0AAV3UDD3_9EURY|nr:helix-turn-helix domain-containing protein [Haladaptatus pallidirubidus]
MSVIADVSVPGESFALHETLATAPETTVEAERLATHSAEWVMPFLWTTGGDSGAFHEAVQGDSTVDTATIIEETDDSRLYKIVWEQEIVDLIEEIIDQEATILEAKASEDVWRLKLRFAEEELVSSFQNHFLEQGHEFEVNHLSSPTTSRQGEFGLTKEQHDALVTAIREGYFEIPRSTTNQELADALGISSNATSQRIRRASANLIRNTLIIDTDEE